MNPRLARRGRGGYSVPQMRLLLAVLLDALTALYLGLTTPFRLAARRHRPLYVRFKLSGEFFTGFKTIFHVVNLNDRRLDSCFFQLNSGE